MKSFRTRLCLFFTGLFSSLIFIMVSGLLDDKVRIEKCYWALSVKNDSQCAGQDMVDALTVAKIRAGDSGICSASDIYVVGVTGIDCDTIIVRRGIFGDDIRVSLRSFANTVYGSTAVARR